MQLTGIERALVASLLALPLHQFEEYELPGGGPIVINRYFYGEKKNYLRYPGNWNSIMIVNLSAYVFYILAVIFPNLLWLGAATMLFDLYQVVGHGFQMNLKMHTWYNPGMGSAVLLFLPIAIWYFCQAAPLMGCIDWVLAVLAFAAIAALTVVLPVQGLKSPESPYAMPEEQAERLERVRAKCSLGEKRD